MTEKKILTVKCSGCGTTLQIRTRSAEKTVACPKCRAMITVSTGPAAAPEEMPFAAFFEEPPAAPPAAEPAAAPRRRSPAQLIAIGAVAGWVLLMIVVALSFRSGQAPEQPHAQKAEIPGEDNPQPPQQSDPVPLSVPGASGAAQDQPNTPPQKQAAPPQMASSAKQAVKAEMDQLYQAYMAADSVWRQRRDWRLANEGRLRAMGIKLVPVEQEPSKQAMDRAKMAFDLANRMYQQSK